MKKLFLLGLSLLSLTAFTSCTVLSLASLPVKVAGDVVEGAYDLGKGAVKAVVPGGEDDE